MFGKLRFSRLLIGAVILAAECAGVVAVEVAMTDPAQAQFFSDDRYRGRPQRSGGFFENLFGPATPRIYEREPQYRERREPRGEPREPAGESSRAPSPRKAEKGDTPPTTSVVVLGDGMADWLAYGLEDAFADAPEIGIIRKNKIYSGLLHYESKGDLDWWHVAREILAPEKPSYVIMMLGVSDRQNIRERDLAKEADKKEAEKKKAKEQQDKADPSKAATDKTAQTPDAAADKDAEDADEASIIAPEPQRNKRANGVIEFRSDRWATVYSRRIDETIAALKSKGVPVFWVGLPSIRGTRSTADVVYLNDLYRARAEKAGAVYIDVWDGFVDESGKYSNNGPDFEGQVRRLRSADGVYFTKYGARKLAHYVERELRRYMSNRSLQISLPSGPVSPQPGDAKSAARPLAGPVVPLTAVPGNSDEQLLGGPGARPVQGDAIATSVLVKGEPVPPAPGRADDFVWPRGGGIKVAPPAGTTSPAAPAATAPAAGSEPSAAPANTQAEPKAGDTGKATPNGAPKPRQQRTEESKPKPAQANAPRPPRPVQSSGPLGWLR